MPSPLEQLENLRSNSDFIFLVFYRGHWCPFCLNYIKSFTSITPSLKAAGGQPVIVTAEENPEFLTIVRNKTGYKDAAIQDPKNVLAADLKKQGLLEVAITSKGGYENGMAQPAVLVMDKAGKVLHSWAIKPSLSNIGGAKDRPSLVQIWDDIQAGMQGRKSVHGGMYSKQTFFQGISTKLFG